MDVEQGMSLRSRRLPAPVPLLPKRKANVVFANPHGPLPKNDETPATELAAKPPVPSTEASNCVASGIPREPGVDGTSSGSGREEDEIEELLADHEAAGNALPDRSGVQRAVPSAKRLAMQEPLLEGETPPPQRRARFADAAERRRLKPENGLLGIGAAAVTNRSGEEPPTAPRERSSPTSGVREEASTALPDLAPEELQLSNPEAPTTIREGIPVGLLLVLQRSPVNWDRRIITQLRLPSAQCEVEGAVVRTSLATLWSCMEAATAGTIQWSVYRQQHLWLSRVPESVQGSGSLEFGGWHLGRVKDVLAGRLDVMQKGLTSVMPNDPTGRLVRFYAQERLPFDRRLFVLTCELIKPSCFIGGPPIALEVADGHSSEQETIWTLSSEEDDEIETVDLTEPTPLSLTRRPPPNPGHGSLFAATETVASRDGSSALNRERRPPPAAQNDHLAAAVSGNGQNISVTRVAAHGHAFASPESRMMATLIRESLPTDADRWLALARTPLLNPNNQPAYRHFQRWAATRHILQHLGLLDASSISVDGANVKTQDVTFWLGYASSTWGHNSTKFRTIRIVHEQLARLEDPSETSLLALNHLEYFSKDENALVEPPLTIVKLPLAKVLDRALEAVPDRALLEEAQSRERSKSQKRSRKVKNGGGSADRED